MRARFSEELQRAQAELLKVGLNVVVLKDDGSVVRTKVVREPWQLGHGDWVVGLDGIFGGYAVMRVAPAPKEAKAIITITEQADGETINITCEFDPPTEKGKLTGAERAASIMLNALADRMKQNSEGEDHDG